MGSGADTENMDTVATTETLSALLTLRNGKWRYHWEAESGAYQWAGCPRNKQIKILVWTETNRNKIYFGCVSVCLVKPKTKFLVCFGLFQFVSVFWTYIETTETNRTVSKQPEIFWKNTKICSLLNCFAWSSFCFGSIETFCFSIKAKQPKQKFCFGYCRN